MMSAETIRCIAGTFLSSLVTERGETFFVV